jgi:cytochrome c biogenesis protein CcdA/thiol-disulfide isomerase/thioredoxin
MLTLALIGFVGGLITGISPCILPVLPVIFLSGGAQAARVGDSKAAAGATKNPQAKAQPKTEPKPAPETELEPVPSSKRPYLVIAGLVVSFSVFTLVGSLILSLLHLPQDFLRWAGLVVLVVIGVGLIVPRFQEILEKPFSWIPQRSVGTDRGGFVLGLALGAVYVPCAGPVLAAITVAGATGKIGLETIVLTATFAIGAAIPLLVFALAGRAVAERVKAFRAHQRGLRLTAGIVMIALAVALTFDLPDILQRLIPDYTSALQQAAGGDGVVTEQLDGAKPPASTECYVGAPTLVDCGPAPAVGGIASWLNTPGGKGIELASLKGSVVLIDFWAYSCINCQRAAPHVNGWWEAYKDDGLTVIGVHSPEYAFEKVESNVAAGAKRIGITYPIALDNDFTTWTNFRNNAWPAEFLIDAEGNIRHISFGEGKYSETEDLIRQLLIDADASVKLPAATEVPDKTPQIPGQTPESYLNATRVSNYSGAGDYAEGTREFSFPSSVRDDTFALNGTWNISASQEQGITAIGPASIRLNYLAQHVYLNVSGPGTLTVTRDGKVTTIQVSGEPNIYDLTNLAKPKRGTLDVKLTDGMEAFSFTFG